MIFYFFFSSSWLWHCFAGLRSALLTSGAASGFSIILFCRKAALRRGTGAVPQLSVGIPQIQDGFSCVALEGGSHQHTFLAATEDVLPSWTAGPLNAQGHRAAGRFPLLLAAGKGCQRTNQSENGVIIVLGLNRCDRGGKNWLLDPLGFS